MAALRQQINLYQPIFRHQRPIFSANVLAPSLAVLVLVLVAISGYGLIQVRALEAEAVFLDGQERAQSAQLASLDQSSGIRRRDELEAELARLNARLTEQQRLVDVLEDNPPGEINGFSELLAGLGRRRTDGVWLTRIEVDGGSGGVELAGQSIAPELVPVFLQALSEDPALSGRLFDAFELARESPGSVSFRVASRAVSGSGEASGGRR